MDIEREESILLDQRLREWSAPNVSVWRQTLPDPVADDETLDQGTSVVHPRQGFRKRS